MKFNKTISEALPMGQSLGQPQQNQINTDDLSNPALKNILVQIEQTKKRHAKEIESLMKRLELVKAQASRQTSTSVPGL